jgi:bifunctional non-homologous end joining protein LigD
VLYAFDLLFLNGKDWRREPLLERRSRLEGLIDKDPCGAIQFSDHYDGEGIDLFKGACELGLEGIVSKRALSSYRSGPSRFWLKTKNVVESELVLLGTDYDNEGKPIAYLGKAEGRRKEDLRYAETAFLTLSGEAREKLQDPHCPTTFCECACLGAQSAQAGMGEA